MRKLFIPLLVAMIWGGVPGGGFDLQAREPIDGLGTSRFCPACWVYVEGPTDLDSLGVCTKCGRKPVEIRTGLEKWFWCGRDSGWRTEPCGYDSAQGCCRRFDSRCAVLRPGEGTPAFADYCPACERFCWDGRSSDGTGRCSACGKAAVAAPMTFRRWYWCGREGIWRNHPCMTPPDGQCGREFMGPLLVTGPSRT